MKTENITVGIAETEDEFNQIHKLNYETFVEEIGQHNSNPSKKLVDVFNNENIYYIAKINNELVGMIALRDKRPFSLDKKIDDLDLILPKHKAVVEIRLLSVKREYRNSKILLSLLNAVIKTKPENSYDLAVISGILEQRRLYEHIGFENMGSVVGDDVKFQPMFLTKGRFLEFIETLNNKDNELINLLPGPVEIADNVKKAFFKDPISHRSTIFEQTFYNTKANLLNLTSAKNVEILTGTGTTANDVIAGQLSLLNEKGLIISNGEFGERLFNHADNFSLDYTSIKMDWGKSFSINEINKEIQSSNIKWLWFVHHETSTGMLNNFDDILTVCKQAGVKVCVDVISSLGTENINLSQIYLASAVSSKGLASFSGLAIVFYNHNLSKQNLPLNINLSFFRESKGIPFTLSSNLLFALNQSLLNFKNIESRINNIKAISSMAQQMLEEKGIKTLVNKEENSNSTITIALSKEFDSCEIGNKLKEKNILISFESEYLIKNNWIQICFMGANPVFDKVKKMIDFL